MPLLHKFIIWKESNLIRKDFFDFLLSTEGFTIASVFIAAVLFPLISLYI